MTEGEYKETDRETGRERRKRFEVPFYAERDSIVCQEGRGSPTDTIFRGDPTPDMVPIDDEAKEISASFASKWAHPIESLPGQGFSSSLLTHLERQLEALAAKAPIPAASSGISKDDFEDLKSQIDTLMAKNAELEEKMSKPVRR